MEQSFTLLQNNFKGELFFSASAEHQAMLMAYSTDASVYQEKPIAVALPKDTEDVKLLIDFANKHKITLIPRAAGTSLAGQVVGKGIVVDISRYFNQVLEVNTAEKWVRVQPGVIRDDLNYHLKQYGLLFGPETSTANRAMIGGMVGNNSCGLHSIVWGAVRDHLLEAKVVLSDGTETVFKEQDAEQLKTDGLQNKIYSWLLNTLSDPDIQNLIKNKFPKPSVVRRNSGYAIDSLLNMQPFTENGKPFNLCSLLAGSEGTLAFVTEVKLNLLDLPPAETAVVCIHTASIDEALRANIVALKHKPMASELVDKCILDFTIDHPEFHKNRNFIVGDPAAILMVEFMAESHEEVNDIANQLIEDLQAFDYGYAYPVLFNNDSKIAWEVRKSGLGLLRNIKGDTQPVNLIEDCAVDPHDLPEYIQELGLVLKKHRVNASYYAHAGAGELHVEPMVNLKSKDGLKTFRAILADTVELVKKYRGSLSGEHGDGRLRGEYIPAVVGNEIYDLFKEIKALFDPNGIFNAGKITGTPAMDTDLRVKLDVKESQRKSFFNFTENGSALQLSEKCSGSGDCRKSAISGGVMCPSYMATRNERDTTRARANVLRQFLSNEHDQHPFNHEEIKEVMDLCISCKGCKTDCPSGVDVSKLKAEFLQHYYDENGIPFRSKLIGNFSSQMKLASIFPTAYNLVFGNKFLRKTVNSWVGFHAERSMPLLGSTTLKAWYTRNKKASSSGKKVHLFCDEFTNYNDVEIGKKTILLLQALGFEVIIPEHLESGRTYLSKGLVRKAKEIANKNIRLLSAIVTDDAPLVGIEPSAILTFRDEYPDLADGPVENALKLAKNVFTIEEFIAREWRIGNIDPERFSKEKREIKIHGHCYQKALSSQDYLKIILSIPVNYTASIIPSGCCGMAGSFGYEEEHYDVSQQIGELILFPEVRKTPQETIIAASGTSCRHQIKDGTSRVALHPVEILYNALV